MEDMMAKANQELGEWGGDAWGFGQFGAGESPKPNTNIKDEAEEW